MARLDLDIDVSPMLEAIVELTALTRSGVPEHLKARLERLNNPEDGGPMIELPPEEGGASFRLGPSSELLCILATLRALKGADQKQVVIEP